MKRDANAGDRSGQTLIFMALALVALLLAALWNFDLHKILYVKHVSRNAGDAAALAAARWQALTLNLVGELNVMQAVAITGALSRGETNFVDARAIADLQARLSFVGPITGLAAAQQAAKNNGMYANPDFTRLLGRHAEEVSQEYETRYPDPPYVNDPSPPTAWDHYAQMLNAVAGQGVAAYPENAKLYLDYEDSGHFLLNPNFYDAVSSADWCWFHFYADGLLGSYGSWKDWPPLPVVEEPRPINSEFFGLHLRRVALLEWLPLLEATGDGVEDVTAIIEQLSLLAEQPISMDTALVATDWYCYREGNWSSWSEHLPGGFPFLSDFKPEYDYLGSDAAILIETGAETLTPGAPEKTITWTAAAKPLGHLDGGLPPHYYGLVLPAFHEVALIPVDASTAPAAGSRPGWAVHIYEHLPNYMESGLAGLEPSCWYCQTLVSWEDPGFRQEGKDWLALNSDSCVKSGPGSGPGGGTRRGH